MNKTRTISKFAVWKNICRGVAFGTLALLGASCSGPTSDSVASSNSIVNNVSKFSVSAFGVAASPRLTSSSTVPKGGGRAMVGSRYKVAGRWYTPTENTSYDETGTASWYGPNFHGRLTANGEIFDQFHLSGAHTTLPLPSYVRVQNLANGRSVVVRLNDRGPFAHNRLIDVSKRTAEVLGFIEAGTAQVRVTYLGRAPVEGDDTRYLVSSIDAPGVNLSQPGTRSGALGGPSIISREGGGLFGAFANLFSYSETQEAPVTNAQRAASAMGSSFVGPMDLGTFSLSDHTFELARQFARLSAVEAKRITEADGTQIRLMITHLKAGVTLDDVLALRADLGL